MFGVLALVAYVLVAWAATGTALSQLPEAVFVGAMVSALTRVAHRDRERKGR